MRHVVVLILVGVIAGGCAAETASNPPSAQPTVAPTVVATEAPTEVPAPTEAPTEAPTPAPAGPLVIDWQTGDLAGIGSVENIVDVAKAGDTYVLVAALPYLNDDSPNSAAWVSTDGERWDRAKEFPVSDRILSVTTGGPGFVAAGFSETGAAVWTSADGRSWQPVTDSSLQGAVINTLVATDGGIVGFGWYSEN